MFCIILQEENYGYDTEENYGYDTEENYGYDTEKNSYPLEQLDADIENMMNSDEFNDAIQPLSCRLNGYPGESDKS